MGARDEKTGSDPKVAPSDLPGTAPAARDERRQALDRIVADYTAAARLGSAPPRDEVLRRHPDLASELNAILIALHEDTLGGDGPPSREADPGGGNGRPRAGSYFGDYYLTEEIARGGMGVVFKATQRGLNRTVALKTILGGQLASQEEVDRFLHEAESAANLDHPGIVPVHEIGESNGYYFFSMGFVEGETLSTMLERGPLDPRRAAEIVVAIAEAVAYAHRRGVIHRDLKPGNVLVDTSGQPRVTDFGLAKRVTAPSDLTVTGQVLGTPSFMAPEQVSVEAGRVGPCTDVYSIGAILYALLTGRPPFQAANVVDTLNLVQQAEPVRPSSLQPGVPLDLETICLKCLEKSPQDRYASAQALATDLRRHLAGEPISARPVSSIERSWRWCRRNPVVAGLVVSLGVALVLGAAVSTAFAFRSQRQAQAARIAESSALRAERLAHQREYDARALLLQASWEQGNLERFVSLLDAQRPTAVQPDLRGFEWYYWANLRRSGHRDLLELPAEIRDLAFDRKGERLALAVGSLRGPGEARVWSLTKQSTILTRRLETRVHAIALSADGRLVATATGVRGNATRVTVIDVDRDRIVFEGEHGDRVFDVAFAPDGTRVAAGSGGFGEGGHLKVWDLDSKTAVLSRARELPITCVVFTPDGERVLAAVGDHGAEAAIEVWDATTGQLLSVLDAGASFVFGLDVAPDGETVAAAVSEWSGEPGRVVLWNLRTGRRLGNPLVGHDRRVVGVHFSPDGSRVASSGWDNTVRIWSRETGAQIHNLRAHEGRVEAVRFHPDGVRLASGGLDGMVRLWDTRRGQGPVTFGGGGYAVADVALSPDGGWLAGGGPGPGRSGRLRVWRRESAELAWEKARPAPVRSLAISPDGRTLAAADAAGGVSLLDLSDGAESRELRTAGDQVHAVAFSPDGEWLAAVSNGERGAMRLWRLTGDEEVTLATGSSLPSLSIAFSPDGRYLAWPLWEPEDGERSVGWIDFDFDEEAEAPTLRGWPSPDSAVAGSVVVWDLEADREAYRLLQGRAQPLDVSFSPDGRLLATANADGTLRLWDVAKGAEAHTLRGHSGRVHGLAFSPDSRRIASGGQDATVRIWNVETGLELLSMTEHEGRTGALSWSANGQFLASAGADGTVKLWDGSR